MSQPRPFTDVFLRKLKAPLAGRPEYYDSMVPGFGIRLTPGGAKTFFVVCRHRGAFRRITLGRYPTITLVKARRKANDTLTAVSDGIDPAQEKRTVRANGKDLFPAVVDSFISGYCKHHNRTSTAAETERLLRAVYIPRWKARRLEDLSKRDVLNVLDDIMAQKKPSAARHAFATIRKFFNWCVERELIALSPCLTIKPPAKANSRDRVLNEAELAAVLNASMVQGWPFGPIVQLLALTAQRRGEVVGIQWNELDLDAKLWTIPGARTKNHRAHVVPLTTTAVAIIQALPRFTSEFVFPARSKLDRAYLGYSKGKRELDALANQHAWTLHDLRRTAATGMARAGIQPHVVERVLNHVSGTFSGVAGVYNRFAYLDEMRAALTLWEVHVLRLCPSITVPQESPAQA